MDRSALHVVVFGRPGSGKSSLAERLGAEHGFVLVRTGERLREAIRRGDDLGRQVESLLAGGRLVPDALAFEVLIRDVATLRADRLLFDGFPRTVGQVPLLERLEGAAGFRVGRYVDIAVSVDEALRRMGGRRVCPSCGATYHLIAKPPEVADVCDLDGTPLIRRADDAAEVLRTRQDVFDEHTGPVIRHYRRARPESFLAIDGEQGPDLVYRDLSRALGLD